MGKRKSGVYIPDEIPSPLAGNKTNAAQIEMCFRAAADPNWQVCATVNTVFAETDGDYVLFMMFDE